MLTNFEVNLMKAVMITKKLKCLMRCIIFDSKMGIFMKDRLKTDCLKVLANTLQKQWAF